MKHCEQYFTAEIAKIAEPLRRDYLIFFLGVLCELCGELLCFYFDQAGKPTDLPQGPLTSPKPLSVLKKCCFVSGIGGGVS